LGWKFIYHYWRKSFWSLSRLHASTSGVRKRLFLQSSWTQLSLSHNSCSHKNLNKYLQYSFYSNLIPFQFKFCQHFHLHPVERHRFWIYLFFFKKSNVDIKKEKKTSFMLDAYVFKKKCIYSKLLRKDWLTFLVKIPFIQYPFLVCLSLWTFLYSTTIKKGENYKSLWIIFLRANNSIYEKCKLKAHKILL